MYWTAIYHLFIHLLLLHLRIYLQWMLMVFLKNKICLQVFRKYVWMEATNGRYINVQSVSPDIDDRSTASFYSSCNFRCLWKTGVCEYNMNRLGHVDRVCETVAEKSPNIFVFSSFCVGKWVPSSWVRIYLFHVVLLLFSWFSRLSHRRTIVVSLLLTPTPTPYLRCRTRCICGDIANRNKMIAIHLSISSILK